MPVRAAENVGRGVWIAFGCSERLCFTSLGPAGRFPGVDSDTESILLLIYL
jgi:hypothetical protein